MSIVLPALAVAFGAFCVWLFVRIVNRRERWAKWVLAALIVVLSYPLGFGPVCWLSDRKVIPRSYAWKAYNPLAFLLARCGSNRVREAMVAFGQYGGGQLKPPMQPTAKAIISVAHGEAIRTGAIRVER